jgi:hypothetical protein
MRPHLISAFPSHHGFTGPAAPGPEQRPKHNLYDSVASLVPDLRQIVGRFTANAGPILHQRRHETRAFGRTVVLSLTVNRVNETVYMAVLEDVTKKVIPNSSGGLPGDVFVDYLGVPLVWIPHSYNGCKQYGPDEHLLVAPAFCRFSRPSAHIDPLATSDGTTSAAALSATMISRSWAFWRRV